MAPLSAKDLDWKSARDYLSSGDGLATTLMVITLAQLGEVIWELPVLEVYLRLEEAFSCKINPSTESRLQVGLLTSQHDVFFWDPAVATAISNTLNHGDPGVDLLNETPTLAELTWALYEETLLFGEQDLAPAVEQLFSDALQAADSEGATDSLGYLQTQYHELREQLQQVGVSAEHLRHLPAIPGLDSEPVDQENTWGVLQ